MANKHLFLKEWRKKAGLTQEKLGARVGVAGPTISRWETGAMDWTGERIGDLADALDVEDVADLFRDPNRPLSRFLQLVEGMPPDDQERVYRVAEAMAEKKPATTPRTTPITTKRERRKTA